MREIWNEGIDVLELLPDPGDSPGHNLQMAFEKICCAYGWNQRNDWERYSR